MDTESLYGPSDYFIIEIVKISYLTFTYFPMIGTFSFSCFPSIFRTHFPLTHWRPLACFVSTRPLRLPSPVRSNRWHRRNLNCVSCFFRLIRIIITPCFVVINKTENGKGTFRNPGVNMAARMTLMVTWRIKYASTYIKSIKGTHTKLAMEGSYNWKEGWDTRMVLRYLILLLKPKSTSYGPYQLNVRNRHGFQSVFWAMQLRRTQFTGIFCILIPWRHCPLNSYFPIMMPGMRRIRESDTDKKRGKKYHKTYNSSHIFVQDLWEVGWRTMKKQLRK
jgi:hypothetical protein